MKIGDLKPGDRIRIKKDFVDKMSVPWSAGQMLTVRKIDYHPYDGDYVLAFDTGGMSLSELWDDDLQVIDNRDNAFFEIARD